MPDTPEQCPNPPVLPVATSGHRDIGARPHIADESVVGTPPEARTVAAPSSGIGRPATSRSLQVGADRA